MASAFVYGTRTLNDNWYEDRVQPACSSVAVGDMPRVVRKYETDIAYIGERYDVLTRLARVKQNESFATPDDGFREKLRTSTVDFAHPKSHKEFVSKPPSLAKFMTTETIPEVCFEERRPLPGNARGFGAVFNRHDDNHGIRYWNTTNDDCFGQGVRDKTLRATRSDPALLHPSGVSTEHEQNRMPGMKVGLLCGEEFRDRGLPASDTRCQRAWVQDASLRNIHHGGTKPSMTGRLDNHLSVPIGDGAMAKVRQDLAERQGRLFRVATNITKGRDKQPGIAIFKDDP